LALSRSLRVDSRRNRQALLAAARAAFRAGEGEAHIEKIARRAGLAVGTLYRHFETREALVEEVYRQEIDQLCVMSAELADLHAPDEALGRFMLLLVEQTAAGKGVAFALEGIMTTDSPIFDDARAKIAQALDRLLEAGAAAKTIRGDIGGRTLLRAMGGICGVHTSHNGLDEAACLIAVILDGLRFGARKAG